MQWLLDTTSHLLTPFSWLLMGKATQHTAMRCRRLRSVAVSQVDLPHLPPCRPDKQQQQQGHRAAGELLGHSCTCPAAVPRRHLLGFASTPRLVTLLVHQVREDHGRVRCLYRQYQMPTNTPHQKQLLALDIIRHSSIHSKKEDMVGVVLGVRCAAQPA